MHSNRSGLLLQKEAYEVVGCAIEVLNVRGHGLHEKIYENCLCVELRLRGIPYTQQERHRVLYKGESVGEYIPDSTETGRRYKDNRSNHGPRTWPDAKLCSHHNFTRWDHLELQTRAAGMGASRVIGRGGEGCCR